LTGRTPSNAREGRRLIAAALCLSLAGCGAPSSSRETLTLLAPAAPGGGWDQTARVIQKVLGSTGLAAKAQVVNVPGAGGVIGLAQVVKAHQGDRNLMMMTGLIMMGAILTNKSAVTMDQVTPLARLLGEYEVLVVTPDSPYRTLGEFVKAWQKDPGALAIAGGSAGGTDHMLAGLLALAARVDVARLNYLPHSGGGESLASILGGHVAAGINGYAEMGPFIKAGRLRVLGISSEARVPGLDFPTFKEQGIDVSLANWRAVAAPPGISAAARASLLALLGKMHASDAWKDALRQNNWIDLYLTGPEYDQFLEEEGARVATVLKSIGLVN
jgi:putative tricarboxylic transport membrane protein